MSTSNIIVRVRYTNTSNKTRAVKGWNKYVSKKEQADHNSLDQNDSLSDYLNYANDDSYLNEKNEICTWNIKGDIDVNSDIKNKSVDDKGVVWDMVVSFNPTFAYSNGLITKKDFADLTKKVMPSFLSDIGFDLNNVSWYAGLHRNTKNPHLHICFYEHHKTKNIKSIPASNVWNLKSYIANYLVNSNDFYKLRDKEFNNIAGKVSIEDLTKLKSAKLFSEPYRKELNKKLLKLYNELPIKGRLQYNSKNMIPFKNDLDDVISYILKHDSIVYDYEKYYNVLKEHQNELNALYGNSKENEKEKYVLEHIEKLYSKIGNDILSNYKIYKSTNQMLREQTFLSKHINELNFRSRSDLTEKSIINIGKSLYKICDMSGLNDNQINKVFDKWIKRSKFTYDKDYILSKSISFETDMSSTDFYASLNKLGYGYDRYKKIKDKHFYQELNYKIFFNRAIHHLMYEIEQERKQIEKDMEYELEGF